MIQLPATPRAYIGQVLEPAFRAHFAPRFDTPSARLQLTTTALQESGLRHRWQVIDLQRPDTKGPARGLLQFERGGGVRGVLRHPSTKGLARLACVMRKVDPEETAVWHAIETDDILGAVFGRLLLLADPQPLPEVGDAAGAFECYVRCWRPGAYDRGTDAERAELRAKWARNYAQALAAL